MTKKILGIVCAAALTFANAACTPEESAATAKKVQDAAVAICGFLPETAVVTNILDANTAGAITGVTAIAEAICQAVLPMKAGAKRGAPVTAVVNGVRITGHFVQ
ncbi:MAG TPA: hypothetical protein VKT73_13245 [Xanthobacteraceae bacterium]|nr:hypothetical protein [Xanthobacteraceae bacterium]